MAIDGPRAMAGNQLFKRYGNDWRREQALDLRAPLGTNHAAVALDGGTALLGVFLYPQSGRTGVRAPPGCTPYRSVKSQG